MPDPIKIEQALFGYRDGHNLVASSVVLAPRARQFLATITDSSGPESAAGFEVAFTGLPVPETDFYALFCTWPAPEMPRPGCVWSHVVLVELADLALISNLICLRKLCSRPSIPLRVSDFERPITFNIPPVSTIKQEAPDPKIVGAMLIAATYVSVRESVSRAGSRVMLGAFRWLDQPIAQKLLPSQSWREALAPHAVEYLTQENNLTPSQLAFSAWFFPPEIARRTLSADRDDVQNLAKQSLEILPQPLRIPTAFLLATVGLRSTTSAGASLIVRSFYSLHDALATRNYPEDSWLLLTPELPYLGWWSDWDRCKKLRRAVNDWITKHVKAGNPLLDSALTSEQQKLAHQVSESEPDPDDFID